MITPFEQSFLDLFRTLDADNHWDSFLTTSQLHYVRQAVESPETWLKFLSGTSFMAQDDDFMNDHSNLSDDDIWSISAIVRKRLTFAAIDQDFFTTPADDRENDHGLMSGDDGGYTDYHQLNHEEILLRKEKSGVFRLYGYQGDQLSEMPKPLFGGRVRELLMNINKLCKGDAKKAIMKVVDIEARDEYDSVEDCFAAIQAFICEHSASLQESHGAIETMLNQVRKEYEQFCKWFRDTCAKNRAVDGVLGTTTAMSSIDDEECIKFRGDGKSGGVSIAKRPRAPVFGNCGKRKNDGKSIWEILGPNNSVVKNLGLYERVIKLKKEMCRLQDVKEGKIIKEEVTEMEIGKPEIEVMEVGEDAPESAVTRERAMGEGVVALLLSHTGFTDSDNRALEILTDVFEEYIHDIGRSLICCRENIDNNAASVAEMSGRIRRKSREELLMELEMVMDCVKGGFAELYNYVRADMMRTEQALKEVEIRLKERVKGLGGGEQVVEEEEIDGSDVVGEDDVVVDDGEGLAFGYLGKRVWLDCLGGVRVPPSLVFDT